jgi:phage antirepressor YoqD-like protein/transposase
MKTTNLLKEIREPKGANLTAVNLTTVTEKMMTVREVAMAMGVSTDTVKNCIRRIMPDKMQNGKTTFLNEAEVACISKELKCNGQVLNHLTYENSSQVKNTTTDLEILENYKKANADFVALLNRMYEEEKQKRELAEKTLNRISDGKGCFTMNQAAKALKLPYGNITLYKNLKTLNILNVDNTPRQEQVNNGNFKVVVKFINDTVGNKSVTLVTSKGLVFLAKKLNTTIDESIKADYED